MDLQRFNGCLSVLNSTRSLPCTTSKQTLLTLPHVVSGESASHSTDVFLSVLASTETVVGSPSFTVTFAGITA